MDKSLLADIPLVLSVTRRYGAEVTHAILPGEARVTIILL
ncbi:unnamed protein product [Spirodela intermedia]|uniref:Uncharacterized protein n=2 Tax=Spirodela intermedia TaxID=51605 RepID=A0A7I8K4P2_SPIIN|nr:unnamed protein product [Spirodela intermedia]CAA6656055.1 unnamed protein product [Spirodela intermedia]CAA7391491.1 unnamed protein product [Spirodela intermedia]